MKILVAIHHPAKVHLFKNFYWELIQQGHSVKVIAIDKEISVQLLDIYNIPFEIVGTNRRGTFNKALELVRSELVYLRKMLKFKPDVIVGDESPAPAHIAYLLNKPYIAFADTEHAKLTWQITKPFIRRIITPKCFMKDFGKKHIRYNGFKELAYLHPNYFKPDPTIFEKLGFEKDTKYVFMRFISWGAQHDKGHQGISDEIKLKSVKEFSKYAKVVISSESELPDELKPYKIDIPIHLIHQVLYYSSMYFGESGTMATESAILGTPTIRISTIAKLLGNFQELSNEYQLIEFYDSDLKGFERGMEIIQNESSKEEWKNKANNLISDKIDVTRFMIDYVLNQTNYKKLGF